MFTNAHLVQHVVDNIIIGKYDKMVRVNSEKMLRFLSRGDSVNYGRLNIRVPVRRVYHLYGNLQIGVLPHKRWLQSVYTSFYNGIPYIQ